MHIKIFYHKFLHILLSVILFETISFGQEALSESGAASIAAPADGEVYDQVNGNLIQFNDNGAWCWYQDERAVVDASADRLIVGCVENGSGVGGPPRQGDLAAIDFDLQTGARNRSVLKDAFTSYGGGDDHNAPAFLVLPNGNILAMYAGHNNNNMSYYRIQNAGIWGSEGYFDWNTIPGGTDFPTTYSNLFYLSGEEKVYNFARSDARSPNFIVSTDFGETWSYGGRLTQPDVSIGYVNGYFKYWSNGVDRIDFICTEHHPRDYNTSLYHGYIQNGQSFQSDGTLVDADIFDQEAPTPADFTQIFAAGTILNGITMTRCWNTDLQRYDDGTLATVITARTDDTIPASNDPEHAFIYCRYDGSNWTSTYLGKAEKKMYSTEQDYTGLGALHPQDPNTIYISTSVDPRDDMDLEVHEIFKGTTADHGATWAWTPVTQNSVRDNFRPIVPVWDENHTALLWWRGAYNSAHDFDAAVVGIIEDSDAIHNPKQYIDADLTNTTLSDGSSLTTSGPDTGQGPTDNQWHQRTGVGNGGSVLTSAETGGEDAPALKTQVTVSEAGIYDVWVNFWANPIEDWRIKAGLAVEGMQLFRQMACKQVEGDEYDTAPVLTEDDHTYLYQAYLGRVQVASGSNFDVFVDDDAVQTGTQSTLIGRTARTWYDGVSTACTDHVVCICVDKTLAPTEFNLNQNYPNPFNPITTITYSLSKDTHVRLKIVNLLGQEIVTLVDKEMSAGDYQITWNAENIPSGLYFYRLTAGHFSMMKKMMLLK